jgi:hypothetical protein
VTDHLRDAGGGGGAWLRTRHELYWAF